VLRHAITIGIMMTVRIVFEVKKKCAYMLMAMTAV